MSRWTKKKEKKNLKEQVIAKQREWNSCIAMKKKRKER